MKKGILLCSVAVILFLGTIFAGCAPAAPTPAAPAPAAGPEYTWKFEASWVAGFANNDMPQHQAALIEKFSDGRIKIDYHYGNEIVPEYEVWDAVGKGILDAGHT